jgi:hypothetical protein
MAGRGKHPDGHLAPSERGGVPEGIPTPEEVTKHMRARTLEHDGRPAATTTQRKGTDPDDPSNARLYGTEGDGPLITDSGPPP